MAQRPTFTVQIGMFGALAVGGLQVVLVGCGSAGNCPGGQGFFSCWFAGIGARSWCLRVALQVEAHAYARPPAA